MEQLTSLDAQFLAIEDGRVHGHICGLLTLAPGSRMTEDDVRRLVAAGAGGVPALRRRIAPMPFGLTHPCWQDTGSPDPAAHVHAGTLPWPGGPRELAAHVATIHERPLDRRLPLWELHLVDGLRGGAQALLMKAHHAVTDGAAGLAILAALFGGRPDRAPAPLAPAPTDRARATRTAAQLAAHPLHAAGALPRVLPHLDAMPMTRVLPGTGPLAATLRRVTLQRRAGVPATPRTSLNGRVSARRSVALTTLDLDAVHAARAVHDATVNDLVVTLVAGALRGWLLRRSELPAVPLVAMVPVSLRRAGASPPSGNQVGSMLVPIPTHVRDPARRLPAAMRELRAAKARHARLPATLLQDANALVPPAAFGLVSRTVTRLAALPPFTPPCNVVISNVPGPPTPVRCAGVDVEALHPISAIVDGVGLNVTVVGYAGRLHVGIVADRAQMPDPDELADHLHVALDELQPRRVSAPGAALRPPRSA